jgi:hypothetical protein
MNNTPGRSGNYFLQSIERDGENRFLIRVSSSKGDSIEFILLRGFTPAENGEKIIIYNCERDEDSLILSRDLYDIRSLLKAVSAFDAASHY